MDRLIARSEEAKRDIYLLVGKTAKAVLWTLGVITALGTLGINVAALVAGLGLTGFALGFALRDAISNLLAGVMIMLYRPFRRRDRILVTGFEGVVAEMNLRYTVLEAEQRTYLVPNSLLLNNPIIVLKPTQKTV
ncbi:MAG: mechanosensitive ion channel [Elusimicrobia bacterium]|nr:mechanosensitive ion channel [Elusimicrobiota bacterium]